MSSIDENYTLETSFCLYFCCFCPNSCLCGDPKHLRVTRMQTRNHPGGFFTPLCVQECVLTSAHVVRVCMWVFLLTCVWMQTCGHVCVFVFLVSLCVCRLVVYVCAYVCMCTYVCVCVHVWLCVCVVYVCADMCTHVCASSGFDLCVCAFFFCLHVCECVVVLVCFLRL